MNITFDLILNATEDDCPIPTIKTKEALDTMSAGSVLKVVTKKEGTIRNIRTFVRNNNCELIGESISEDGFHFYIQKL